MQAVPTRDALTAYLPRLAIDWEATAHEQRWRGIDGSLVFVDISGFTALSERLGRRGRVGTEELTDVLSTCFAELLEVAYAQGGSLLKFGGDALLLLFEGADHAQRACISALRMRTTMRTTGRISTSAGVVRLRMSVGVHSGLLHVFRVGGSHRELILTGPGASETVAMESAAEAGEILISPSTAVAVDAGLVGNRKGPGLLLRNRTVDRGGDRSFPPVPDAPVELAEAVPVALREHLVAGTVESEHRHATLAFVHFDGVDALLETAGPEAVAAALDGLVRDIQAAAEEQAVTFLGSDVDADGGKIILVAGAPRALGDEEDRMLRALRRIVEAPRALPVRIGVNRGHVFVGEVGPPYRRTYTVMGDAVNLAARVMAKAEPGQVLATAEVLDRARTAFQTVALPPFMVKGKSNLIEAFAVGAAGTARTARSSSRLPFMGRASELGQLLDRLEAARRGTGSVVEVVGEAGIGKSRLIDELRHRAGPVTTFEVACEPYESASAYYAFRQLLLAVLGQPAGGAALGHALRQTIATVAPELLPWLPLLADVAGATADATEATSALEPKFRRERTHWVVGELLRSMLSDPALIVVDNAQWMDDASAETLATLAAASDRRPWLLCVVRRDEPSGFVPPEGSVLHRLNLEPFDVDTSNALVAAATRDAPLRPHEREALVRQAGGMPLFLEELVLSRDAAEHGSDSLPESLEAVLATQIDRLAPLDRRLLRYAAVLGFSFDPPLLARIVDPELRDAAVAAGRRLAGFLEADGRGRLRFRNHCLRDVAYGTLPYRRRRELHSRAADATERAADDRVAERAEILSLHYLHAQRYERCWHYARMAARAAEGIYANVEAAELYQRALTAGRYLPELSPDEVAATWESLGDVSDHAGIYDRAAVAYRRARRLRKGSPLALGRLYGKESQVAGRRSGSATAIRWIRHGLRVLDGLETPDEVRQRAELRVLYAAYRQAGGRHREAVRWCERALEEAGRSGNKRALAQAYMVLDWAYIDIGRLDLATNGPKALAIWEELGDLENQAGLLNNLGGLAYYQGRWDEALALYERGREANTRIGKIVDAATCTCNIAEILIDQGRLDEAEPALREVAELWQSVGYTSAAAFAGRHLGRIAARRGDHDAALLLLEEARATFAALGEAANVLEVDAWLAYCLLRRGEVEAGLALVEDALRREAATGGTTLSAMLHRLRGYAHAASGRLADAWADFDESLHVARSRNAPFEVALTFEAIAVVAELGGLAAGPEAAAERDLLLRQLGVRETPRPPLVSSVGPGTGGSSGARAAAC